MFKILKELNKSMAKKDYHEHLDYILKNTTAYQRMIWLKRTLDFWKALKKSRKKPKSIKTQHKV